MGRRQDCKKAIGMVILEKLSVVEEVRVPKNITNLIKSYSLLTSSKNMDIWWCSASKQAVCVSQGAWGRGRCADLVIEIPGSGAGAGDGAGGAAGGQYRLDYRPPHGSPAPNFTLPARASTINFQGLPGTKYHFMLYYSNATFADLLTWNQTIITGELFLEKNRCDQ